MTIRDGLGASLPRRSAAAGRSFILWALALTGAGLALAGCTPTDIPPAREDALLSEVQNRGLIVGLEGLQPFSGSRAQELVAGIGNELGLAHAATSGNYMAHMPIIEQANQRGQPIYLVGYSLGGDEARGLAQECRKRGIPIRILFLLDPHYVAAGPPARIPPNVRRAFVYTSGTFDDAATIVPPPDYLTDTAQTALIVEDMPDATHMDLPSRVTGRIQSAIAHDLQQPAALARADHHPSR